LLAFWIFYTKRIFENYLKLWIFWKFWTFGCLDILDILNTSKIFEISRIFAIGQLLTSKRFLGCSFFGFKTCNEGSRSSLSRRGCRRNQLIINIKMKFEPSFARRDVAISFLHINLRS
jgi:hypothetical protein